jgi:hypothetical protein
VSNVYSPFTLCPLPGTSSTSHKIFGIILFLSASRKTNDMESRRENMGERRRRKIVSRPVLVRSVKPGQVMSASYERQRTSPSLWKAA